MKNEGRIGLRAWSRLETFAPRFEPGHTALPRGVSRRLVDLFEPVVKHFIFCLEL